MKRITIAIGALLAVSGCQPFTAMVNDAQIATAAPAGLVNYEAFGGEPFWNFKLINSGTGFTMEVPGPTNQITHTGVVTSQTDLSGGNWLIKGTVGAQPITVLIENLAPGGCSENLVDGDDRVRVVWDGYLFRGCDAQ